LNNYRQKALLNLSKDSLSFFLLEICYFQDLMSHINKSLHSLDK
jgi:hypothetical protein